MATADQLDDLEERLDSMEVQYKVKISDLDQWLEDNREHNEFLRSLANLDTKELEWTSYHTYEEVAFME